MENIELLKSTLNLIGSYLCIYDGNGRIIYCNDNFKNAFARDRKQLKGLTYSEVPSKEYHTISFIPEVLNETSTVSKHQCYGTQGSFLVTTSPVTCSDGSAFIVEIIEKSFEPLPASKKKEDSPSQDMILSDAKMKSILETILRISNFDSTILITGESGTGKSMLAKFIHNNSKRRHRPFVTINCATIPENLIESELFGYVSGAFTGANQKGKPGMIELANKGTLFLDEIGLLPLNLQSKFLQLIQEKTYIPIGALENKTVDIRIISATNLDLKAQIALQKFREDLYYRLRVIEFQMPPLRDRQDAIRPLIDYFLQELNKKYHIKKTITEQAKDTLKKYKWAGNIRELQYILEKLFVTSPDNQITTNDLPPLTGMMAKTAPGDFNGIRFEEEVEQFEKELLWQAYTTHKSSYKVAKALDISQTKASRLLRKYNIK